MKKQKILILLVLLLGVVLSKEILAVPVDKNGSGIKWLSDEESEGVKVHLYFFWTETCPHCQLAQPFVASLAETQSWLSVHSLPLMKNRANVSRYIEMAAALGEEARSVPAFLFCGQMMVGYDNESSTGRVLKERLQQCYQTAIGHERKDDVTVAVTGTQSVALNIPFLSDIDIRSLSLPVLTVVLAGLDSFNPCAFFVLLALLSLLVHARSRARMLVIGGIFVFFSGFIYYLFMAAWLNLFLVIGQLAWVTLAAGALAMVLAVINIKDYFWFGQGVSLSIPDRAKPGLFQRMRDLLQADNWSTMVVGAVTLAVAANSYELLCTAGFPMTFTRVLTLHELLPTTYYLYLLLYTLIYIVPLFIIVMLFTLTLGARKLSENEGRILKLLSGVMMAELGVVLIIVPEAMSNVLTAVGLLAGAGIGAYVIVRFQRIKASKSF